MKSFPSYLELYRRGELISRIDALFDIMRECCLCPRQCGVRREEGERGICEAGSTLKISSVFPHFGEEPPLVGWGGSGTIFFSHCNLRCIFCQNFDISHKGEGSEVTVSHLAGLMIDLQRKGCHNINFVTPTHYAPLIVAALPEAIEMGLEVPLVWNCGGYESIDVIKLLDGIVDIYMPDIKYSNNEYAEKYSKAPRYFDTLMETLKEMYRQVGNLENDGRGIARRGLLIRHLVMPGGVAGTDRVVKFIAEEVSKDSYVNIMDQYHPCFETESFAEINRRIADVEYREAVNSAKSVGLHRGLEAF